MSSGGGEDGGFDLENREDAALSLADHLEAQVGTCAPCQHTAFIAHHLIAQLDEAGYLTVPLRDVAGALGVPLADAERALECVQSMEPTGVGARDLGECLALQAKEADRYDPCMEVLLKNLDLVAKGAFAQLKRICRVDDEDLADMLNELRGYDPKPGLAYGGSAANTVVPDVLVSAAADGRWDIR